MPTFVAPTYNQPVRNRLGEHGVAFPVGYVVYICTDDTAHRTTLVMGAFSEQNCPDGFAIAAGSGDGGYAIFRRGKTYTVTTDEGNALTAAGETVT